MFRGFYIEMVFLKVIGGWLEGSGWIVVLIEVNVVLVGIVDFFLKVISVIRARRVD